MFKAQHCSIQKHILTGYRLPIPSWVVKPFVSRVMAKRAFFTGVNEQLAIATL